jgi:gamma-glutamyltranspeptidase / glutathione hydrolase
MFTPDPNPSAPEGGQSGEAPINGFYRAGSDHRKDGGAVGW